MERGKDLDAPLAQVLPRSPALPSKPVRALARAVLCQAGQVAHTSTAPLPRVSCCPQHLWKVPWKGPRTHSQGNQGPGFSSTLVKREPLGWTVLPAGEQRMTPLVTSHLHLAFPTRTLYHSSEPDQTAAVLQNSAPSHLLPESFSHIPNHGTHFLSSCLTGPSGAGPFLE